MPSVGDRQRVAVVGMVTTLLFVLSLSSAPLVVAQVMTLPSTPTTEVRPSTTVEIPVTTTAAPSTSTSAAPRSTTTSQRGPGSPTSPSTTARRQSPTTSTARTATTAAVDESPTTTEPVSLTPSTERPPRSDPAPGLPVEQAARSTGLSTGSLVALVVAGLLAVALALSALTVRYVRATRPEDRFTD